jgi:hypothetical protein
MTGIPAAEGRKTEFGAPGKSGRAIFALSPRPPLRDSTKEIGLIFWHCTMVEAGVPEG